MNTQPTFNLEDMMNEHHKAWQNQHYFELFARLIDGKVLSEEEVMWMAEYKATQDCKPSRPSSCYSCGKDLTSYPTAITGCPKCHHSFVE